MASEKLHRILSPGDEGSVIVLCPDCGQMETWSEAETSDHGKCRASREACPVCGQAMDENTDEAEDA